MKSYLLSRRISTSCSTNGSASRNSPNASVSPSRIITLHMRQHCVRTESAEGSHYADHARGNRDLQTQLRDIFLTRATAE